MGNAILCDSRGRSVLRSVGRGVYMRARSGIDRILAFRGGLCSDVLGEGVWWRAVSGRAGLSEGENPLLGVVFGRYIFLQF